MGLNHWSICFITLVNLYDKGQCFIDCARELDIKDGQTPTEVYKASTWECVACGVEYLNGLKECIYRCLYSSRCVSEFDCTKPNCDPKKKSKCVCLENLCNQVACKDFTLADLKGGDGSNAPSPGLPVSPAIGEANNILEPFCFEIFTCIVFIGFFVMIM